jgi:hypothetical protein
VKIADLFIAIGISGAANVKNTLGETQKGLGETASSALYTKAAIIGALYALERLVSASNHAGAELQSFAAYSGFSAEKLQRLAYAGRQFGATGEDIKGSIMGITKAMAQLDTTGKGPEGLWVVSRQVGLDKTKLRDAEYVFGKLQEFAQKSKLPIGIANQALESFGLSAGTIAAMRQNAFNPAALARANIYTDKQTDALARMNAQWGNLFDNWEKMIGRLNTKHGGQLIKDLTGVSREVEHLITALAGLADKLKFFQVIGLVMKELAVDFKVIGDMVSVITGTKTGAQVGKEYAKMKPEDQPVVARMIDWMMQKTIDTNDLQKRLEAANPQYGPVNPNVQLTQNFYGPTDPKTAGSAARAGSDKGVSDAVRQSQALRRKH